MTIDDGRQRSLRPACTPIDTDGPRFTVLTVTGYPITRAGTTAGNAKPGLSATVLDRYYGTEHGTFSSWDVQRRGIGWVAGPIGRGGRVWRGVAGALAAAEERCAELNAWHEREGWDEDDPLEALLRCQGQAGL